MNTKFLLAVSAVVMGVFGAAGLFVPDELLRMAGHPADALLTVGLELLAALYFAFAFTNWTARGSLIGGIYNRPLALGNLTHFLIGSLTLMKAAVSGNAVLIVLAIIYGVFALAFGAIFFRSPVTTEVRT